MLKVIREQRGLRLVLVLLAATILAVFARTLFPHEGKPSRHRPEHTTQPARQQVVIATTDIALRSVITEDMIRTVPWPRERGAPPREAVTNEDEALYQVARTNFLRGDLLRRSQLAGKVSGGLFAYTIPPGKRAVAVPAPEGPSMYTMLRTGDRVDVIGTFQGKVATAIVTDAQVLAVDNRIGEVSLDHRSQSAPRVAASATSTKGKTEQAPPEGTQPKPSIVLAVTPKEAEKLALAAGAGQLSFVLCPKPYYAPSPRRVPLERPQNETAP